MHCLSDQCTRLWLSGQLDMLHGLDAKKSYKQASLCVVLSVTSFWSWNERRLNSDLNVRCCGRRRNLALADETHTPALIMSRPCQTFRLYSWGRQTKAVSRAWQTAWVCVCVCMCMCSCCARACVCFRMRAASVFKSLRQVNQRCTFTCIWRAHARLHGYVELVYTYAPGVLPPSRWRAFV